MEKFPKKSWNNPHFINKVTLYESPITTTSEEWCQHDTVISHMDDKSKDCIVVTQLSISFGIQEQQNC